MIASSADNARPKVLIVDESADTREVLRTVLERRGVEIFEASEARDGAELMRREHPAVIVLDHETATAEPSDDATWQSSWHAEGELIVLGKAGHCGEALPRDRIIPKPYHFAPLIHKIEQLLSRRR